MTRSSFIKSVVCGSLAAIVGPIVGSPLVGTNVIDRSAVATCSLIDKWKSILTYQSDWLSATTDYAPMIHTPVPEHLWAKAAADLEATERRLRKQLKSGNVRSIGNEIIKTRRKYDPEQQFYVAGCTHERDITNPMGICLACEYDNKMCQHPQSDRVAGPRINVMWGSRETVVCSICGKWKVSVDHTEWRTDSLYAAIKRSQAEDE